MEKNVLITVSGLLFTGAAEEEQQDVEVIAPGEYFCKNGKHYVLYDEVTENDQDMVHNVLKISQEQVNIRKKGLVNTELVFSKGKETVSHYSTPYGNLILGICANELEVQEEPQGLRVNVQYALEINYEHITNCFIKIHVQNKAPESFSLLS